MFVYFVLIRLEHWIPSLVYQTSYRNLIFLSKGTSNTSLRTYQVRRLSFFPDFVMSKSWSPIWNNLNLSCLLCAIQYVCKWEYHLLTYRTVLLLMFRITRKVAHYMAEIAAESEVRLIYSLYFYSKTVISRWLGVDLLTVYYFILYRVVISQY